jgi:hypothetical protein
VISQVLRVAWYRLRATFARRWGGYLGLMLLIGLVGGIALGAGAAARRTESSFPVFLASTNPSDLTVQYESPYYAGLPAFARAIALLPHVKRAEIAVEPIADVLGRNGAPTRANMAAGLGIAAVGSVNGLYFNQDRVAVIRVAGDRGRGHRHRRRSAPGHRPGPVALDPVRPADLRGARTYRPGRLGGPGLAVHADPGQPGGGAAGTRRGPDPGGSRAAYGMTTT